ncbi:SDR family oxidoreductase [Dongia deserti]|uniref:SDR family oxidoreductase n=1 Tax=Dongia deserti TaxID=2268030 RepID=UPI000E6571EC|nr:SDR family oxidoreductase [Dongia deserti]
MDLGIAGKKAIVCGASKGLGRACAEALAREGVKVTIAARHLAQLAETAEDIRRATGSRVTSVVADVTTAEGRQALLAACPNPDILVTNAGGPPAGDFRDWSEYEWHQAVQNNMVTHILLIKAVVDGMIERRWGRIVNITSAAVKSPYPSLGLSNGARAGLTGFVAGLSRQVAKHNVTINNLLPGSHETERLVKLTEADAKARKISLDAALTEAKAAEASGRFGTPEEFGAICAFLCSQHAGYIVGQNVLVDGGTYPGTL